MKRNFALYALVAMVFAAITITGCKDPESEPVKVSSVAFKATPAPLEVGASYTFEVTVLPEDAENKDVTWDSSNKSVATVSRGEVTTLAVGKTTISATASDGSGKKAEFEVTVSEIQPPAPFATITSDLSFTEVNEIKYSEAVDQDGSPLQSLAVKVESNYGIGEITLKLTTGIAAINTALEAMGLAEGFELASMPARQAGALAQFMPGLPTGDAVTGENEVTLDFSSILPLVASITGGVDQFDIDIAAEDVDGVEAQPKTLKLKFIDDVTVWGTIAGDGFDITEAQVINKSEAAGKSRKIDIASLMGIENLFVEIDNARINAMIPGGFPTDLDLANPGANAQLLAMIGQMGLTLPSGDDVKGKTQLSLNMTAGFIGALVSLGEGSTAIKLTVKDAAGHAVTETLTITIVDDLTLEITGSVGETPIEIKMSDALAEPIAIDPVAVDIVADKGIENFMVEIDSSSNAFKAALTLFKITGAFDLANPGEELAASLTTVGLLDPETPIKGATEMQFDVTEFIPLIFQVRSQMSQETGDFTASFKLTITDGAGQTKEATIALNLVDNSASE